MAIWFFAHLRRTLWVSVQVRSAGMEHRQIASLRLANVDG